MTKRIYDSEVVKERLKSLRKETGLTQAEVATAIHFSVSTLKQYESGYRVPDETNLGILAKYYKVPTGYILGTQDYRSLWDKWEKTYSAQQLKESRQEIEFWDYFLKRYNIDFQQYSTEELEELFRDIDEFVISRTKELKNC